MAEFPVDQMMSKCIIGMFVYMSYSVCSVYYTNTLMFIPLR